MICPFCKSDKTKVVDKRDNPIKPLTRRRRECLHCLKRFTTYESIQNVIINVIKRSGKIEDFSKEKLKLGLLRAIKKRNIKEEIIDGIINKIENDLLNLKSNYVKSTKIGDLVLKYIKDIDHIGYLLYASVYKDFKDLNALKKEIYNLENKKND